MVEARGIGRVGSPGQLLEVISHGSGRWVNSADATQREWIDVSIRFEAEPFVGVLDTVMTPADVAAAEDAFARLLQAGEGSFGGGSAPLIRMTRHGPNAEIEATVPSEDDPQRFLRFLIFRAF